MFSDTGKAQKCSYKTKLSDDDAYSINVFNGYIYYTNNSDGQSIYKIKVDGSSNTRFDTPTIYENESNDIPSLANELNPATDYGDAKKIQGNLLGNDVDYFKGTTQLTTSHYYLEVVFIDPKIGSNFAKAFMNEDYQNIYSIQSSYSGIASFTIDLPVSPMQMKYYIKISSPNGALIETGKYDLITWYNYIP